MITKLLQVTDAAIGAALPVTTRHLLASLKGGQPVVHTGGGNHVPITNDLSGYWSYQRLRGEVSVTSTRLAGDPCEALQATVPLRIVAMLDRDTCIEEATELAAVLRASTRQAQAAIGAFSVAFDRLTWSFDQLASQEFTPMPQIPTNKTVLVMDASIVVRGKATCMVDCEPVDVTCAIIAAATLGKIRECLGGRLAELCDIDCPPTTVNGVESDTPTITVLQGGNPVGTLNPATGVVTIDPCAEPCEGPLTIRVEIADAIYADVAIVDDPCGEVFVIDCNTLINAYKVEGCGCPLANTIYRPLGPGAESYVNVAQNRTLTKFPAGPGEAGTWTIRADGDIYYQTTTPGVLPNGLTWEVVNGPAPAPTEVAQYSLAQWLAEYCGLIPECECPIEVEVRNSDGDLVDSTSVPDACAQVGPVVVDAPDATVTFDGQPLITVPSGATDNITCNSLVNAAYVQDGGSRTGTYKVDGTVNGKDRYRLDGTHTLEYSGTRWEGIFPGPDVQAAPGNEDFPWQADWSGTGITVTQASIAQYCDQCDPPTLCEQIAEATAESIVGCLEEAEKDKEVLCELLAAVLPENAQEEVLDCVTPATLTAIEDILFPLGDAIIYQGGDLLSSGQITVYRTGDEGTMNADGRFSYNPTIGRNTIRQRIVGNGSLANWTTLVSNNIHGNTNRFTNRSGGAPATTGNRIIQDHLTGWEWYVPSSLATLASWNTAIDNGVALNATLGETGWYVPNDRLIDSITYDEPSVVLNYGGFLVAVNLWTSSTQPNSTTLAKFLSAGGQVGVITKTSNIQSAIFCRRFG